MGVCRGIQSCNSGIPIRLLESGWLFDFGQERVNGKVKSSAVVVSGSSSRGISLLGNSSHLAIVTNSITSFTPGKFVSAAAAVAASGSQGTALYNIRMSQHHWC